MLRLVFRTDEFPSTMKLWSDLLVEWMILLNVLKINETCSSVLFSVEWDFVDVKIVWILHKICAFYGNIALAPFIEFRVLVQKINTKKISRKHLKTFVSTSSIKKSFENSFVYAERWSKNKCVAKCWNMGIFTDMPFIYYYLLFVRGVDGEAVAKVKKKRIRSGPFTFFEWN